MDRRRCGAEHGFEQGAPFMLRRRSDIAPFDGEQIESDERGRALRGQPRHARRRRMKPELERIEVEAVSARNHDLAVNHGPQRELVQEHLVQLGEVSIQRFEIPALDEDVGQSSEDDGAKPVPLRLV